MTTRLSYLGNPPAVYTTTFGVQGNLLIPTVGWAKASSGGKRIYIRSIAVCEFNVGNNQGQAIWQMFRVQGATFPTFTGTKRITTMPSNTLRGTNSPGSLTFSTKDPQAILTLGTNRNAGDHFGDVTDEWRAKDLSDCIIFSEDGDGFVGQQVAPFPANLNQGWMRVEWEEI